MIQEDPNSFNDTMESPLISFRGRVLNKNTNFEIKSPRGFTKQKNSYSSLENEVDNEIIDIGNIRKCPLNFNSITQNTSQSKVNDSPRSLSNKCNSPRGKRIVSNSSSPNPKSKFKTKPSSTIINSSRLPVKQSRFSAKDIRLPLPLDIDNTESSSKVTPEKLMEELRIKVQERLKVEDYNSNDNDEDEYKKEENKVQFNDVDKDKDKYKDITNNLQAPSIQQPRMSLRNRCPIIVNAPDLIYEDPLEVARQTLQNTRTNSGYRQVKLIYTTEKRENSRPGSPVPAFSKKKGISRHFIRTNNRNRSKTKPTEEIIASESGSEDESNFDDKEREKEKEKKLKFDRVLQFFEHDEAEEEEERDRSAFPSLALNENFPLKSCLKKKDSLNETSSTSLLIEMERISKPQTEIVQIKRIYYEGDEEIKSKSTPSRRLRMRSSKTKENDLFMRRNIIDFKSDSNSIDTDKGPKLLGAKRLKKS